MSKTSKTNYTWNNDNLLYLGTKVAEIIPSEVNMLYRIKWIDGSISDHYNLTRAKDNAQKVHSSIVANLDGSRSL